MRRRLKFSLNVKYEMDFFIAFIAKTYKQTNEIQISFSIFF